MDAVETSDCVHETAPELTNVLGRIPGEGQPSSEVQVMDLILDTKEEALEVAIGGIPRVAEAILAAPARG
jgi:hypothetical protein